MRALKTNTFGTPATVVVHLGGSSSCGGIKTFFETTSNRFEGSGYGWGQATTSRKDMQRSMTHVFRLHCKPAVVVVRPVLSLSCLSQLSPFYYCTRLGKSSLHAQRRVTLFPSLYNEGTVCFRRHRSQHLVVLDARQTTKSSGLSMYSGTTFWLPDIQLLGWDNKLPVRLRRSCQPTT